MYKTRLKNIRFFCIGLLIALATQTKEIYFATFAFALFACLKQFKSRYHKLLNLILGYAVANLLIFSFLFSFNELDDYVDVLAVKRDRFRLPDLKNSIVTWVGFFQNHIEMIGILTALLLLLAFYKGLQMLKRVELPNMIGSNFTSRYYFFLLMLTAHVSILVGLFWGNRNFLDGHVAIAILFPLVLLIGSSVEIVLKQNFFGKSGGAVFGTIFVLSLAFNTSLNDFSRFSYEEMQLIRYEDNYKIINSRELEPESCIQQAYGWNAGAVYFYTGFKPCSRYFLINLIIADPDRLLEFRKKLSERPPEAIIYETQSGPDLDWARFEENYFPYGIILKNCYLKREGSDVFFARFSGNPQKECVAKHLKI